MVLMAVFAVGNLASALAATFDSLMLSRFLAGLPHGAYFGVASVVAAALVPADRRARAVSLVMVGLTVANIAGVPGATWLGQMLGWQALYVTVTVIALLCLVATLAWVPPVRIGDGPATIRSELSALARPQVWFTLAVGMVGFGGMFATYSYVAPTVTTLAGLGELGVVAILATYGVGMTIGMVVGGRLADRALLPTLYLGLVGLAVVLAAFGFLVTTPAGAFVGVFGLGAAGSVLMPALQTRLMDVARDGQSLAAALNHAVLNIGNAFGAWLGRARARARDVVRLAEPGRRGAPAAGPGGARRRSTGRAPLGRLTVRSEGAGREGVARVRVAGLEALLQPLLAVGRRPVGPALRVDLTLHPLLDPVVADRGRRVDRVVQVLLGEGLDG